MVRLGFVILAMITRSSEGWVRPTRGLHTPRASLCLCRDTTTETLRSVFSQYGELEDAIVTMDRVTGKSKGYGFVTFRYSSSANAAVAEPEKQIDVSQRLGASTEFDLLETEFARSQESTALSWRVHVAIGEFKC